jgi:hypothetical protein
MGIGTFVYGLVPVVGIGAATARFLTKLPRAAPGCFDRSELETTSKPNWNYAQVFRKPGEGRV